jgi:PEP-CTERM motif
MNMNKSRSRSLKAATAIVGTLIATSALATTIPNPAPLAAGGGPLDVPVWGTSASNYSTSPRGAALAYCVNGTCALGSLSKADLVPLLTGDGAFLEVAGTTTLNPFGSDDVTLAFAFTGGAASGVTSVELPGLSTFATDVQACDPSATALLPCPATSSGATATRNTAGDITFTATSASGLPTNVVDVVGVATDVYAVYTDAPIKDLVDPIVVVTYADGGSISYNALSLMSPSTGKVPEPSALSLLALGLASLGLGMILRRRAR